ncbi:hypothetical protein Purlil1_12108 [Purpureocillium lilacinum]|uniref:Uncharacterized protein n=1 Tax=Purpureocillium lilacinum TaxID=33203 RepID=A0ABR0BIX7_PURLI|nr:hypothetical protein Purlil1_12108 [Purpureocillium lilacinum]
MARTREHPSKPSDLLPGDETDSDVVCLGSRPVAQIAVKSNKPNEALAGPSTTSKRARTRRRGHGRRSQRHIPSQIVNRSIVLGSVRGNGPQPDVVGFFDHRGRFRLMVRCPGCKPSKIVKHEQVEFGDDFRGCSKPEVPEEVLRRLLAHVGPPLGPGEI